MDEEYLKEQERVKQLPNDALPVYPYSVLIVGERGSREP